MSYEANAKCDAHWYDDSAVYLPGFPFNIYMICNCQTKNIEMLEWWIIAAHKNQFANKTKSKSVSAKNLKKKNK